MMRRQILQALILTLLLPAAGTAAAGDDTAILPNGGFEAAEPGVNRPSGWFATVVQRTATVSGFRWDEAIAHGGSRSVSVVIGPGHPDERIYYNWTAAAQGWQVGGTYELTGWIRAVDLSQSAAIVVQCWDEPREKMLAFATTQTDRPVTGTADWTPVRTTFTVPEGTFEVRVRAGIAAPANRGGRAWFDDLAITPLH